MKRLALASLVLCAAAAANAMLYLRPVTEVAQPEGAVGVEIGAHRLDVPRALMRDPAQRAGGRLARLDLVVAPADFAPLPPVDARTPESATPEHVSLVLTAPDDRLPSIDMFGKVYARFIASETLAGPAGLMQRRFREKTPYEDRELYLGVGTGRTFVALCPLPEAREKEPCTTTFRLGGIDLEMSFPAHQLPQWRAMSEQAFALVEGLLHEERSANRVALPPEK